MANHGFFILQETLIMAITISSVFARHPRHSNSTSNSTPHFRSPPPSHSNFSSNSTTYFRPPPPPHFNSSHNSTPYFRPPPPPPPPSTASPPHSISSHNSTPHYPPPPPPSRPKPPHSMSNHNSTPNNRHQHLIDDVIEALIRSGDFSQIGMLLSAAVAATPSLISLALPVPIATLFIPNNAAMAHLPARFDPFVIPYHIIPGPPLSFSDLLRLGMRARLPTLLPSNSIIVTNNSAANFSLDDSQIVRPDLFHNAAITVHGIKNILDYSIYGAGALRILSQPIINQNLPHSGSFDCSGSSSLLTTLPVFYLLLLCYFSFTCLHIFA